MLPRICIHMYPFEVMCDHHVIHIVTTGIIHWSDLIFSFKRLRRTIRRLRSGARSSEYKIIVQVPLMIKYKFLRSIFSNGYTGTDVFFRPLEPALPHSICPPYSACAPQNLKWWFAHCFVSYLWPSTLCQNVRALHSGMWHYQIYGQVYIVSFL